MAMHVSRKIAAHSNLSVASRSDYHRINRNLFNVIGNCQH